MRTRGWVLGLVVPVVLGLAGCGGEDGSGGVASAGGAAAKVSASASLKPEDARLKFAQCMRQNGVDIPDPKSGQNFRMDLRGKGDTEKLQAAMGKCRQYLEAAGMNFDLDDPEVRDAMVKFAQCARKNGIDIPDPKPGEMFGNVQGIGMDKLRKARELCGHHLQGIRERTGR